MTVLYIVIAIVVIIVLWAIYEFNHLITLKNRVKEAWADIDVQLKRRYDLIPNLVETVKGYASHEKTVFEDVTNARTSAMNATAPADKAAAENQLSGTLKSLFAVSENYPNLKANENFVALQNELSDTENKIQAARRFYNGVVQDQQNAVQKFPSNIIAGIFHFTASDFFQLGAADEAAREPVKVQF